MSVAVPFSTVTELFDRTIALYEEGTRPVLLHKSCGAYRAIAYRELRARVEQFALGLASLGIRKGDRVALISENRPEWVIADLAMMSLGVVGVPVYPTLTPQQMEFICNDSGVSAVILSNTFLLKKVLRIRANVPTLRHLICMNGENSGDSGMTQFSAVEAMGKEFGEKNPRQFREGLVSVGPDDLLTIIYTSGTTGTPKGVMLSHRNLVGNIRAAADVLPIDDRDVLLSFLPLCHTFERMAGYYTAFACGATIAFAESIDTVSENLIEIRPTIVTTVPRLFERIHTRIIRQIDSSPAAKQKVFHWAMRIGRQYAKAGRQGNVDTMLRVQYAVAYRLVFSALHERTGGRIRYFVSGGAALPRALGEFFEAIGMTILEGYGLTETSPVLTVNRIDDYRFGTVGKPLPGVDIKIAEDGEILAKGPNIMRGYYHNPAATKAVLGKDGWFHTGDVGIFDTEGHLVITDRKKHLFVSSGGKNIAPQPIENLFLQSRFIEQFVLIGDGRMYCTALIVPAFDTLKEFARNAGVSFSSESDLINRTEIRALFTDEVETYQKNLPGFERVRRFELLPEPLTVERGDLTPTLKVKRKAVEQKYAAVIDSMYRNRP